VISVPERSFRYQLVHRRWADGHDGALLEAWENVRGFRITQVLDNDARTRHRRADA
jgi:hypothetical protein